MAVNNYDIVIVTTFPYHFSDTAPKSKVAYLSCLAWPIHSSIHYA